jgi:hypothetical protein
MKQGYVSVFALAVTLHCAPAFAQHGHGVGDGSSMAGGAGHASANANSASTHGSRAAASHGKTMEQLLTQNKNLANKIASLTGESAQKACSDFKNLGQCVAAAHVSKNLGLSFACLKDDMTGTKPATGSNCPTGTGATKMSLGKSIQTLSPTADRKTESKKAQDQADQDLKDSSTNS